VIPVRSNGPLPTVVRVFESLSTNHPLRDWPCPACDEPLGGRDVALVYIGPGPVPSQIEKALSGRWHTGAAVAVHAYCAGVPVAEPQSDAEPRTGVPPGEEEGP
jgi:hypothetical protein